MNEELHIPRFRYLTQNYDGIVRCHINYPCFDFIIREYTSYHMLIVSQGARNPDWGHTLIDLDAVNAGCVGYTFKNGILKSIDG